jgi:hypothetical protein
MRQRKTFAAVVAIAASVAAIVASSAGPVSARSAVTPRTTAAPPSGRTVMPPAPDAAPTIFYGNLAGYETYRAGATTATTTFVAPRVTCGTADTGIAPGTYGQESARFGTQQYRYAAAVDMACHGGVLTTTPVLWTSGLETAFSDPVAVGDKITTTLTSTGTTTTVTIRDTTAGHTFTHTATGNEGYANLEYVGVDAIQESGQSLPVPTFSPVLFTGTLIAGKSLSQISPRTTLADDLGCLVEMIATTITNSQNFTVELPPVNVTDFTPDTGLAGSTLTIDGSGFNSKTKVTFQGGQTSKKMTLVSAHEITALVPLTALSGPIVVTNSTAPLGTLTTPCSFNVQPVILSYTPGAGPTGTSVTIGGGGFSNIQDVRFGAMPAAYSSTTPTSIKAIVPNGDAIATPITVDTIWGSATTAPRLFRPTLAITGFSPVTARPLATVTITGIGFNSSSKAKFSGKVAVTHVVSSTELTAIVPLGSVAGPITVTNSAAPAGTVTANGSFDVQPVITSFTPTSGPTGKAVTINGGGFSQVTSVLFGGMPAVFTVSSSTVIKATVPNGDAVAAPITVTTAAGSASSSQSYTPTLAITGFSPTSGPAGTTVTITGVGFNSKSAVKFKGKAAVAHFVSSTQLTATVPVGALPGPITVTNSTAPAGTVTSASSFG